MTPIRQVQKQISDLSSDLAHHRIAEAVLNHYGLAINGAGELVVVNGGKFAAWLAARPRPIPEIEEGVY